MMFTPIISNFFCQLDLHSCPLCGLWMPFGSWRRHFGQHLILSRSRFEPVSITFSHYHRISLGDIYTYMCMRVCFSACVCEKVIGLFQNILKYDEINHSISLFFSRCHSLWYWGHCMARWINILGDHFPTEPQQVGGNGWLPLFHYS